MDIQYTYSLWTTMVALSSVLNTNIFQVCCFMAGPKPWLSISQIKDKNRYIVALMEIQRF